MRKLIPIALPHNGYHKVFFPFTSHSLKVGKIWPHASSISSSSFPIPFLCMGQVWPNFPMPSPYFCYCSDLLWVNLTCEASDASPWVESYQLMKDEEILATSNKGTWIREILEAGKHVYNFGALHFLRNKTAENVAVTIDGGYSLILLRTSIIILLISKAFFHSLTNNEFQSSLAT